MSFFGFLYELILGPLVLLFDVVYAVMYRMTRQEGLSIIALSLAINFLILPLYRRADAMQEEERLRTEQLSKGVSHIKKVFKGDERFMMLQTYYRQNGYKPYYALNGSLSLLLEIPFFIAAFNFLSHLQLLQGASFGPIRDLGQPDGLLHLFGISVNVLPILMTVINIVSGVIYTRGMPLKSKIQLYGMALIFLVLLYSSPSGLVFYWTLNNLFSLVKNVFYKLREPKKVLCAVSTAIGAVSLPFMLFANPMNTPVKKAVVIIASLLLLMPLPVYLWLEKHPVKKLTVSEATKTDNVIFYVCCVFLTVLTGLLIPSAVIESSPAEFISVVFFRSPVRYLVHSFALAAGTFLIWMNIFYRLSSKTVRRIFSLCFVILSGSAAVNYMAFGRNYGNMSSLLQYDNILYAPKTEYMINLLVLAALAAALYLLWKKFPIIIRSVSLAMCAAVFIMSCMNIFSIQSKVNKIGESLSDFSSNQGIDFSLDKEGKNVVVLMMDRAINDFFPYLIEEKSVLKEQFAGFTYYPNTISYGNCTMVGNTALFGGYEYTPEASNKRTDRTLKEKQNEALKIMPGIFSENGYEVTVCDPTFAGFQWTPDLNIYKEYDNVTAYITKGRFINQENTEATDNLLNRNFFVYSLFRTSPVALHLPIYNRGSYNQSDTKKGVQISDSMYTASGGFDGSNSTFFDAYSVLENLPAMTEITASGQDTFLMMSNDTTHDVVMLQEPQYEPAKSVDNTAYEAENGVRRTADGRELTFSTTLQIKHYQCNMAAMLQLGEWFDYLRENGVYDNTKIIIVSDHGRYLDKLFNGKIQNGKKEKSNLRNDRLNFKAMLLVKDFGSTEFTIDTTFMTNADTPALAFDGLIENPVNPFTGKAITSDGKNVPEHHIAASGKWSIDDYKSSQNQYEEITWVGFKGEDTSDLDSWRIIGKSLKSSKKNG